MTTPAALHIAGLSKRYGATQALTDVSMTIPSGEVRAILGENGAGKSTLVKVLSGVVAPNQGQLELDGQAYAPSSITQARLRGVSTAFQELSLIPNLSVGENLLLPRPSRTAFWPEARHKTMQRAEQILADWQITDISADAIVANLSLAERQRIEIVRAFSHAKRLLILDEPTAALPDAQWLFDQIRRVTQKGVAVIYISHRLGEVREICQSATVLRNGSTIKTTDLAGIANDEIFALMVGHRPTHAVKVRAQSSTDVPLIETKGLGGWRLRDINLTVRVGEIVGVAGLEGQGQSELLRVLGGASTRRQGQVLVAGKPADLGTPRKALDAEGGIAFVPEERKTAGIFANLSAASNIALPSLSKISRGGLLWPSLERKFAEPMGRRVALADRYLSVPVGALSGGNQQKALLARALMTGARCLVLFDPARGVDVGTKQSIYAMMREFVAQGGGIIFYSSELSELVELSSRCLAMYDGRIVAELEGDTLNEESLVAAAHGTPLAQRKAG